MQALELKLPPLLLVLLSALAMLALARAAPAAGVPVPWRTPLAALCTLAGLAAAALGVLAFRRARTTVDPRYPHRSDALVVTGIYRYTRNPMYLGMALALAGLAVYLGNLLALVVLPLFVLYLDRFQIRPEEQAMRRGFGEAFDRYCGAVRRWL